MLLQKTVLARHIAENAKAERHFIPGYRFNLHLIPFRFGNKKIVFYFGCIDLKDINHGNHYIVFVFVFSGIKKGAWKCKVIEKIADCTVLQFFRHKFLYKCKLQVFFFFFNSEGISNKLTLIDAREVRNKLVKAPQVNYLRFGYFELYPLCWMLEFRKRWKSFFYI